MADPVAIAGRVFTISPGRPFLDDLAQAFLDGTFSPAPQGKPTPIGLSKATLLLPSRRSTRAVQDAFLRAAGGRAMLLPRIRPIGDAQEDLNLLAGAASLQEIGSDGLDIPPAVTELQRRLLLVQLVLQWSAALRRSSPEAASAAGAATPTQAVHLAAGLAVLMDLVEREGASLEGLEKLVPEDFSEHWAQTLAFLRIAVTVWPEVLQAEGLLSPMDRRRRMLAAEAARLRTLDWQGPVVIAGTADAAPATLEVIRAVLANPQGVLVLPGLDLELADDVFAQLGNEPDHPQHGLARLLSSLGLERASVQPLPDPPANDAQQLRAHIIATALLPAAVTDRWQAFAAETNQAAARAALAGLARIDVPTPQDEAEVIALRLREVLETPGKTAALVTPDRLLARRVEARLAADGIDIDDSAGRPFAKTPPGAFLDLILRAIETHFAPAPTMALLKHPLTRLAQPIGPLRRAARHLELAVFRAPYLGRGLDGLLEALDVAEREAVGDADLPQRRPSIVRRLNVEQWAATRHLVEQLRTATAALTTLMAGIEPVDLRVLARAHLAVAEALASPLPPDETATPKASPVAPLYQGDAGSAAQRLFTGLVDPDLRAPSLAPTDYPDLYRALVAGEVVRPRAPRHPRLAILGPIEARLQQPDVVILGAMNDGTWPQAADLGPWLNRPMRATLGLPAPEADIGRSAHDVTQLLGAREVLITRALKAEGNPTVPSRWLLRLDALLGGLGLADALTPSLPWLAWARARDRHDRLVQRPAPAPRPPVARRPRKLAVTEVERWIANPYAIYARHVLRLEALPLLGVEPGAALKGAILHDALGRFAKRHPSGLPDQIADELMADVERVLKSYAAHPRVAAFWRPRFRRFAAWFAETEAARRAGVTHVHAERPGKHVFKASIAPFTLTARADRIDVTPDGLAITDYKTGAPPSGSRVSAGQAPQLPLEALIAASGGFVDVPAAAVMQLKYIRASGGDPPGEEVVPRIEDLQALIAAVHDGMEDLIVDYDKPSTPYRALRRASFGQAYHYDDYAHLARVREWAGGSGESE